MTREHSTKAEWDADAARVKLEHTLEELRGRMTPGHVLDEALAYTREGGIGEFVQGFGRQIRDNPLPVALVGTGLAWLMLAGRGGDRAGFDQESRYRRAGDEFASDAESMASKVSQAASDTAARVSETASAARDRARARVHDVRDVASEASQGMRRGWNDAANRASDMGRRAADRAGHAFSDHPLVFGALGLAFGAALASMFPPTQAEDQIAGEASDQVKRGVGEAMEEQAEKATNVAERAYEEGMRAAEEEGLVPREEQPGAKSEAPQRAH